MTSQTFNLDLIPQGVPPIIHVSQYDKGQTWFIKVFENGVPFEIPEGCGVTVQGTKPDNTVFQYACVYAGSIISATLMQQMTAVVGDVITEIRITQNNSAQIVGSLNFITRVEEGGINDSAVISETDISLIEQALELADRVPEIVQECEQYVIDSGENAYYAEKYAAGTRNGTPVPNTDPAYQNNAKYYKEQADNDATTASNAASSAETNAENAEAWGVGERGGVPVESTDPTYENNAKYYAGEAEDSATAAAGSANDADGYATSAAGSATASESYAKGGTGTRTGEDTDNAKYYMEQAAQYAGSAVDFRGATASQDGAHGLVPAPLIADKDKYLKGDGTWAAVQGGGGSSTLAGLTDVDLNNLADGQLIRYDSVNAKWVNAGVDATPTQNSTNPVTSGGVYSALPSTMTGATAGTDGAGGLVPKPFIADKDKFLKGDGTWGNADVNTNFVGTMQEWTNEQDKAQYETVDITDDIDGYMIDTVPTQGSQSIITSGGVYNALSTKANKSDLVNINIAGATNTTGATIYTNTYFYLNGIPVRAKADIANGATFTLNTNYEELPDGALNTIASQKDIYSTTETKTNKVWIDGKPIYRKVINFGALPNTSEKTQNTGVTDMSQLVKLWGIFKSGTGASTQFGPIPIVSKDAPGNQVGTSVKNNGATLSVIAGTDRTSMSAYFIMEYTKSTD